MQFIYWLLFTFIVLVTRATVQLLHKQFSPGDPIPPSHFTLFRIYNHCHLLRIFPFWMKNIESNHHFPCRQWGPFFVIPHWHYSLESTPQPRRCCHHTPQLASAEYIETKWWVNGSPKWIVLMLTVNPLHSSAANPHKLRILRIVLKSKMQISRHVE